MLVVNSFTAALVLALFAWLSVRRFRRIRSPADFFHDDRLHSNVTSLTIANITLGSGVAYLVSGGFQIGPLLYVVPLGILLGYVGLAFLVGRGIGQNVREAGNFLSGVDYVIQSRTMRRSWFGPSLAYSLVFIYLLFIAFEVYASSTLIGSLFFSAPGVGSAVALSVILFGLTLFYTVTGGIRAVFRTDKVQLAAALLLITVLLATVFVPFSQEYGNEPAATSRAVTWLTAFAALNAMLAAVATQFYSLLNWAHVSHVRVRDHRRLLLRVGAASAILLALILSVGVFLPSPPDGVAPLEYLFQRLNNLVDQLGLAGLVLSILVVTGALSILVSTIDSLIIATVMFIYDTSGRASNSTADSPIELRRIRTIAAIGFTISFATMLCFQALQPNIFFLLLSIAGMAVVFAPLLTVAVLLSRDEDSLLIFTRTIVVAYLLLFLAAFGFNFWAMLNQPTLVAWVGPVALGISALLSIYVFLRAPRARHHESPLAI